MRAAATAIVVIGLDTFIVQPGLVGGLVAYGGFDEKQAGYIASAEMFGIAATTIAMTWLSRKISWRTLVTLSLIVGTLANVGGTVATTFGTFAASRFIAGLSSGMLISIGYAVTGLTARPDRNFSLLIVWVLVYGALGVFVMPAAFAALGLNGVLGVLALASAAGLIAVRHLPRGPWSAAARTVAAEALSLRVRLALLGAVLCFFLAQGALWPYLSLIGVASGGTEQSVANALTVAQVLGIAGALSCALVSTRLSHRSSLVGGIVAVIVSMIFLLARGAIAYGAAVCVFNYAANYITPLLMAVIAAVDRSGKLMVPAVASQMMGLAVGPAIGASVISPGDYRAAIWVAVVLSAGCLTLALLALTGRARTATCLHSR